MDRRRALKVLATGAAATTAGLACAASVAASSPGEVKPPEGAVGMLYDATLCIGCKTCMVACNEANELPPDTGASGGLYQAPASLNAKTKNVIKLYRKGEEQSFVKAQCMHCVDPACTTACMMHALKKDERGIVYWEGERCVGCRYCQVACPYGVLQFEWASLNPRIVKCELCRHRLAKGDRPACVEVCPRKAVIYGKRAELLAEAHRRISERPDIYVQKVYGEHDGGGTQVLYISHVDFDKLGLPALGDRPVPETVRKVQDTIYYGFAAPVALYGALAFIVRRNRRLDEKAKHGAAAGDEANVDEAKGKEERP
jgi:Fe-S-cluster-containing dehydrogenase component